MEMLTIYFLLFIISVHIPILSSLMKFAAFVLLVSGLYEASAFMHHVPTTKLTRGVVAATAKVPTTQLFSGSTSSAEELDTENSIDAIHRDAAAIFAVIDVDGSGTISKQELTDHLSVSGYSVSTINKIFAKMDINKDNEISKQEFQGGMVLLNALRSAPGLGNYNADFLKEIYEDADQVFQSADADGNGEIDKLELMSHMGRMFAKYSEGAVENIFRSIDVNGDGKISKEEFRDAFCRYSALRQAIGEGPNYK